MEKHKCKLCARTFSNGRALGGHMKGHPLPPKTTHHHHQLSNRTDSASSSSSSSGEEQGKGRKTVVEDKSLGYGLRENPKKSLRFAADSGSVVQDRESETETESRNPRSKRKPKAHIATTDEIKKPKMSSSPRFMDSPPTELEPMSSVSDTSSEEDVAMCLMLLSRDALRRKNVEDTQLRNNRKHHRKVSSETKRTAAVIGNESKRFECPFCYRVFGSGQALGGHKRSHTASSSNTPENSSKFNNILIDLNLPAPLEDDEFSVVSDA